MRLHTSLTLAGLIASAAIPGAALAAPGDSSSTSGAAAAEIIEPSRLMKLRELRFGAFAQPTAVSTLTVAPDGTATGTGEVATTTNMTQPPSGRGQAIFRIDGTANRAVVVLLPNTITISNGTATMKVDTITDNLPNNGRPRLDANGVYYLHIGGTLNVDAWQAPGSYTGDFTVSVIFQ
ncbi:DUF4402 domain-containing protein [Erythrobacter sp. GH1-10]|uniref:DUF4402 domain-containing protein n=1 Tax=Erythrobacter sp. GH1-10 TaxID=3349334 RepID=UPI00387811C8